MTANEHSYAIIWRRLDQPGLEYAKLVGVDGDWYLTGTVVTVQNGVPCELRYRVVTDPDFRTVSADIRGTLGLQPVTIDLTNDPQLGWVMNGGLCAGLDGCIDVDLAFTPATNTLPIRRLRLEGGDAADVSAAWLRFPEMSLERLDQRYSRTGEYTYRYESGGGTFVRDLTVNEAGLVLEYPGLWRVEGERA
ncbi:MAG TPA: putative glycolipid-binding domain-containing protein [Gemmatimonadaceae bacterium]|nr:putative glycolipid-binding domain-containing protein [Gemmatimonadaceae bacterium]